MIADYLAVVRDLDLLHAISDGTRNLYGAGDGSVHQSAYAAALGGVAWTWANEAALRAGSMSTTTVVMQPSSKKRSTIASPAAWAGRTRSLNTS